MYHRNQMDNLHVDYLILLHLELTWRQITTGQPPNLTRSQRSRAENNWLVKSGMINKTITIWDSLSQEERGGNVNQFGNAKSRSLTDISQTYIHTAVLVDDDILVKVLVVLLSYTLNYMEVWLNVYWFLVRGWITKSCIVTYPWHKSFYSHCSMWHEL